MLEIKYVELFHVLIKKNYVRDSLVKLIVVEVGVLTLKFGNQIINTASNIGECFFYFLIQCCFSVTSYGILNDFNTTNIKT